MATGSHIKVERFGTSCQGVTLRGDRRTPEHETFRVRFPGGEVEISRCTNGDYWVHTIANAPDGGMRHQDDGRKDGFLTDARIHSNQKSTSDMDFGDFDSPGVYDVAVRVSQSPNEEDKP